MRIATGSPDGFGGGCAEAASVRTGLLVVLLTQFLCVR